MQIRFIDTRVSGAFELEPERMTDDRGFFALMFSRNDFRSRGLSTAIEQVNIAQTARAGTLRGMHYQIAPFEEVKVVRCTRGAVHDVVLDLRKESPTFTHWFSSELTADNRRSVYVPAGCAHGYLTLTDDAEVTYLVSAAYSPAHYRGVRWNDPAFAIDWPSPPRHLHPRDAAYDDWK